MSAPIPLEQRKIEFWLRVDDSNVDGCWPWMGALNNSGYGSYSWRGIKGSHQAAWYFTHDKMPKTCVLHECDNRKCCNPSHLFLGTKSDNSVDCWGKGRNFYQMSPEARPRGENHKNAKLTQEQADEIRYVYETLKTRQIDLAVSYGVSQRVISLILQGRAYK